MAYLKVSHLPRLSHRTVSSTVTRIITVFFRWIKLHHQKFELQKTQKTFKKNLQMPSHKLDYSVIYEKGFNEKRGPFKSYTL